MADGYATLAKLRHAMRKTGDTIDDSALEDALLSSVRSIDNTTGRSGASAATHESGGLFFLDDDASEREFDPARTYVDNQRKESRLLIDDIGVFPTGVTVLADGADITSRVKPWPLNAIVKGEAVEALTLKGDDWRRFREILITARWGWPTVPFDIVQANLIQGARLYRRKDSPEGTAGVSEWGVVRVPAMDPDVRNLIKYYIKGSLA